MVARHALACALLCFLAGAAGARAYVMQAHLEPPANISFPVGEIGAICLRALQRGFSQPAAHRRRVSREEILSVLPDMRAGWGGAAGDGSVGRVFSVANTSAVFGWLSQLHTGARHSRYDALDPDVRPLSTAVGLLAAQSDSELLFQFRVHAEFKVSSSPALFVMPGSFEASLHVSRDLSAVHSLEVSVPTDRTFNVLLECGDAFASLGDNVDDAPASPDSRRLSEFKLPFVRREPKTAEWEETTEEQNLDSEAVEDKDSAESDTASESCAQGVSDSEQGGGDGGVYGEWRLGEMAGADKRQVQGASAKMVRRRVTLSMIERERERERERVCVCVCCSEEQSETQYDK